MGIKAKTEVKIMRILADYSAQLDSGAVFTTKQAKDIAQRAYASGRLRQPTIKAVYLYLLNNRKTLKEKIAAGDFTPIQSGYGKTLDEKLAAALAPEFFHISKPLNNDIVRKIHQQVFNKPGTRKQLKCITNSLTKNRLKLIALAKKQTKTEHASGNAESNENDGKENVDEMELDENSERSTDSQASDSNFVQRWKKSDNGLATQSRDGMSHNNDDDETLVDGTDSPEEEKFQSENMIPDDVSQPQPTAVISNDTESLTQPSDEMNRGFIDSDVPLVSAFEFPQEEAFRREFIISDDFSQLQHAASKKAEHASGNAESNENDGKENVDEMELDENSERSTDSQASNSNFVQRWKKSDNGLATQSRGGTSHNNDDDETLVDETDSPEEEKLQSENMIPDDVSQRQPTAVISNDTESLTQPSEEMNRGFIDSDVPLVSAFEFPQEEAFRREFIISDDFSQLQHAASKKAEHASGNAESNENDGEENVDEMELDENSERSTDSQASDSNFVQRWKKSDNGLATQSRDGMSHNNDDDETLVDETDSPEEEKLQSENMIPDDVSQRQPTAVISNDTESLTQPSEEMNRGFIDSDVPLVSAFEFPQEEAFRREFIISDDFSQLLHAAFKNAEHASGNAESNENDGEENVDEMELDENSERSTDSQASDSNFVQHWIKSDNGLATQSRGGMSHNNDDNETLVDGTDSPEEEKFQSENMIPDDVSQPQPTAVISNDTESLTQPSEEMNRDSIDSDVPLVSAYELPQEEAFGREFIISDDFS